MLLSLFYDLFLKEEQYILKIEHRMPRMALVVVVLNLLLCVILCDKKEFIINYEDYEEKIVVFVYAY